MFRVREIRDCLVYGLLQSRAYEDRPHYACSYRRHLWINLRWAAYVLVHGATE